MTDTNDQTSATDEGTVDDAKQDTTPRDDSTSEIDRPDPTQVVWSSDHTEQLPRTEATRQLPVHDEASTGTRESVDTAVFGAAVPPETEPDAGTSPGASTTAGGTPAAGTPAAGTPAAGTPAAAWPPPVPPRPTGPHAPAIILGLVALAVAGIVLAQELGNLTVDWGDVGPLGFVGVGAVLVILGAVGLISSNRRNARS